MAGMQNWVLIANTGDTPVDCDVKVAGVSQVGWPRTLASGDILTPEFPGVQGGPVEVACDSGSKVMVSQRVLYNGYFNEVLGTVLGS